MNANIIYQAVKYNFSGHNFYIMERLRDLYKAFGSSDLVTTLNIIIKISLTKINSRKEIE